MSVLTTLQTKIQSVESVVQACQTIRGNAPMVTTNGCFDLLHAGHLHSLCFCADLSPYLIVLLNSDTSVKSLKGPTRPVVCQDHRALLLASLSFVWRVCIFDELTPVPALSRIQPDIHVKGEEYKHKPTEESRVLKRWGGKMLFAPHLSNQSTTLLLEKTAKVSLRV